MHSLILNPPPYLVERATDAIRDGCTGNNRQPHGLSVKALIAVDDLNYDK